MRKRPEAADGGSSRLTEMTADIARAGDSRGRQTDGDGTAGNYKQASE